MTTNVHYEEWNGFKNGLWQTEINVANFIYENYKEYKGDDRFLVGISPKTQKVLEKVDKLLEKEAKVGLLDVDLNTISGITNFKPGFIDKQNEVIFGLQTDKPLKRIVNLYGGVRMAKGALDAYNKKLNPTLEKHFTSYRKSHNEGNRFLIMTSKP